MNPCNPWQISCQQARCKFNLQIAQRAQPRFNEVNPRETSGCVGGDDLDSYVLLFLCQKETALLSKKKTKNESQTKSKASEQEYSKLIHGHCAPYGGRQHWRLLRLGQVAQNPHRYPHRHRGLDRVGKLCTLSTCKLCIPKSSSVWREALASSYSP